MITRRAGRRSREVRIAEAAAPAACSEPALARMRKIVEQISSYRVEDLCADGDFHHQIFAVAPRTVRALAVASTLRFVLRVVAQMQQRIERLVGLKPEIAA